MPGPVLLPFIGHLSRHLKETPEFLQVILGPRQVGKTTTLLEYLNREWKGRYHYVSADGVFHTSAEWLQEQWSTARRNQQLLVIDEIQKCENWSETIKALWDQAKKDKKPQPCVLLGSSSLLIQKGLTESLTGRFQLIPAYHWNFAESQEGYGLSFDEYLKFGGYPGSYPFTKKNEKDWIDYVRNSIVSTVIEKDILQYHTVKSPALFKQAFEILISYPAQEISYTKLLGQLQEKGNVEIIKYYLELYKGAFLFATLEKFSEKRVKTKTSSPKILPLAPCLYYLTLLDAYSPEERGRVFELVVGAQLVRTGNDLYYWREGNHEVDFVLKRGRKVWAIEVKSGRRKSSQGLEKFQASYPNARAVFVTPENYAEFEKDPMAFLEKTTA